MPYPPVKLSVVREIGWRKWDPIGLLPAEGWEASSAADEYDSYLLNVAARLQKGEPDADLTDYLVSIETEHMGISPSNTTRIRAAATVAALQEYVDGLS
jgi:cytochrome P450